MQKGARNYLRVPFQRIRNIGNQRGGLQSRQLKNIGKGAFKGLGKGKIVAKWALGAIQLLQWGQEGYLSAPLQEAPR